MFMLQKRKVENTFYDLVVTKAVTIVFPATKKLQYDTFCDWKTKFNFIPGKVQIHTLRM